ncbi:MAG: GNAT family N-acetyltransferase [Candidatus Zixiibacteriota bacterium]|nr:MAG: GNAT family N-acetyltransferase [candidate division Zixibacteria bacterium]
MYRVRTVTDIGECRELWQRLMPTELVSDLWEVRDCFHRHYNHPLHFIVAEESGAVKGFLPLSWNEETGQYNYFPGETWEGKTWLEQNRIIAGSEEILNTMLATLDGPYQLRYLRADDYWGGTHERVDEIGYLFVPESYQYDMNRYFETFSHKTAKRLRKELTGWDSRALEWRYNQPEDFEILCQMNISRFGNLSYFHDLRFLESFRSLMHLLRERDWLRIVTIVVDGEPAAVDLGSLYNGMLTMLAGGTGAGFPGIAKLINVHHMTYACEHKLDSVDFLCGDFNWKTLFHLTPAPLYLIEGPAKAMPAERISAARSTSKSAVWSAVPGVPNA